MMQTNSLMIMQISIIIDAHTCYNSEGTSNYVPVPLDGTKRSNVLNDFGVQL